MQVPIQQCGGARSLGIRLFVPFCAVIHALSCAAQTSADSGLQIDFREKYIYVSGKIMPGDGAKFAEKLDKANVQCQVIRLNSSGGLGVDAVQIGTYIRDHQMTTWTDGSLDTCSSACNRIFAGGLNRIYSNAKFIQTGKISRSRGEVLHGLGYHHPNKNGDFAAAEPHYQRNIVPFLKAMLPPKAFDWVYSADQSNLTHDMIWLNGDKALELGISTSDQAPAGCLP
jgi:hypothetical protein